MATQVKRVAIYMRVSTDGQTTENQRLALMAVAEQRGWTVANVYEDAGISGAKGPDKRPGLDALLKDAARGRFDVVMAWAMDRLGRSLFDLLDMLRLLDGANVDLFLPSCLTGACWDKASRFFVVGSQIRHSRSRRQDGRPQYTGHSRAGGARADQNPSVSARLRMGARARGVSDGQHLQALSLRVAAVLADTRETEIRPRFGSLYPSRAAGSITRSIMCWTASNA